MDTDFWVLRNVTVRDEMLTVEETRCNAYENYVISGNIKSVQRKYYLETTIPTAVVVAAASNNSASYSGFITQEVLLLCDVQSPGGC